MPTDLAVETEEVATDSGQDGLFHLYCCDPDVALCGANIKDAYDWGSGRCPEPCCVVCEDLDQTTDGCPQCS